MTFDGYVPFRSNPSNDHVSDGEWAGRNELNIVELKNWKAANPKAMVEILETRRGRYAEKLIEIDQALFDKAKQGDARSIELLWSRFENWSPKIEENNAKQGFGKTKTLAELMGEM